MRRTKKRTATTRHIFSFLFLYACRFSFFGCLYHDLLNEEAVKVLVEMIEENDFDRTISQIISEKTIVNGIIGLLATGVTGT